MVQLKPYIYGTQVGNEPYMSGTIAKNGLTEAIQETTGP